MRAIHHNSRFLSEFNDELTALVANVLKATVAITGQQLDPSHESIGSGWAYLKPGFIVTNHHVVNGLVEPIQIKPLGMPIMPCQVIGVDPENDLALLFARELNVPTLDLSSSEPCIGQLCFAIGCPLGLHETATMGIVSGIARQTMHPDGFAIEEMLQTDASINPGNSGGPLVDIDGVVIGVNTLGKGETVNFAVPAETVHRSISEIAEFGNIRRAALGISIAHQTVPTDLGVQSFVVVRDVHRENSPLQPGDIFVSIHGVEINRRLDVQRALDRKCINNPIEIDIIRSGKTVRIIDTPKEKHIKQ